VTPLLALGLAYAAPTSSAERGLYDKPFSLELTPSSADATIYTSVDHSTPSVLYSKPLEIDGTTTVRAFEVLADGTTSETTTHTYAFVDDLVNNSFMDTRITADATYGPLVEASFRTLPLMVISMPTGLSTTENAASAEWIDPLGDDSQVDCGAEETGGTSDAYAKSSVRLHFRSEYGPSTWEFDVYGDEYSGVPPAKKFNSISLRGGNHDTTFYLGSSGQYLRNFFMDETQLDMGHVAPHGRFVHTFINGIYAGLYHVRERFDANMMAEYLGGSEDDYEAINAGTAFDGSGAAWSTLVANASDWDVAQHWLNVENYLDYMVLQYYAGNAWDWYSTHNWMSAGPTEVDQGGFIFHSSDSDICLYYDYTVNILGLYGPSNIFGSLRTEANSDFLVAVKDAIFRNLGPGGPLDADVVGARYQRLADLAEPHLSAEAARWGFGYWDVDDEWRTERDRLLDDYFPYRTAELLSQFEAAGLYTLDGPEFSLAAGLVPAGTALDVAAPDDSTAELWVSIDGQDPRLSGGELSDGAMGPAAVTSLTLDRSVWVQARLRDGDDWGPLCKGFYEVDATPQVVLNEWNTVAEDGYLDEGEWENDGLDAAYGRIVGNGGDWIELLVLEDGTDLRGWRISMEDRRAQRGELTFTDDVLLSDLRAGTILTIAEDLPEDSSYDPDGGDWRFHLRAGEQGTGTYISATAFDVTNLDWTMTLWDADSAVAFGPAGESVSPADGISSGEVGLLKADPSDSLRRTSADYGASRHSTFGSPNVWDDGEQDLRALRGQLGGVFEWEDTGTPTDTAGDSGSTVDTAPVGDSADGDEPAETDDSGAEPVPGGCGCGGGVGGGGAAAAAALILALVRGRRKHSAGVRDV
jgi:Fn3 associated/CotH kinase protein